MALLCVSVTFRSKALLLEATVPVAHAGSAGIYGYNLDEYVGERDSRKYTFTSSDMVFKKVGLDEEENVTFLSCLRCPG